MLIDAHSFCQAPESGQSSLRRRKMSSDARNGCAIRQFCLVKVPDRQNVMF